MHPCPRTALITVAVMLFSGNTSLRLLTAPVAARPPEASEAGLVIFELDITHNGDVAGTKLLQGQTPFIEHSRLTLRQWKFAAGEGNHRYVTVAFVYKPGLQFPDSSFRFNVVRPDGNVHLHSPYPARIVAPEYPISGLWQGSVVMQIEIDPTGHVQAVRPVLREYSLTHAAEAAVRKWEFFVPPPTRGDVSTAVVVIYFAAPKYTTIPE